MATIAFPVFQSRIAPVFDFCGRLLIIQIKHRREMERSELYVETLSASERVAMLKRAGVTTLICAGISNVVHTMLESAGIRVTSGIIGQVEDVIAAFISNRLDDPQFFMPGRGKRSTDGLEPGHRLPSGNSIRKHTDKSHTKGHERG